MLSGMFAAKRPLFSDPATAPFYTPPYAPTPSEQMTGGMSSGLSLAAPTPRFPTLMNAAPPQMGASTLTSGDDPAPPMPMNSLMSLDGSQAGPGQAPAQQHHGFFSKNGGWKTAVGVLSDAMLAYSAGMGNQGAATMLQNTFQSRRDAAQRQRELADHAQAMQDQQANWLFEQQYKREHPEAPQPTEFERAVQAAGYAPGSPEYLSAMRSYVNNKTTAPPLVQHNADGTLSVYPAGMVPRTATAPQSGPAPGTVEGGYRFKGGNPADPSAWEPVGGASPSGSRTFR